MQQRYAVEQKRLLRRSVLGRLVLQALAFTAACLVALAMVEVVKLPLSNFVFYNILGGSGFYYLLADAFWWLLAAGYAAGLFLIVRAGVNRSLRYFDLLISSVEDVLAKREGSIRLPLELAPTAAALNEIKEQADQSDRAAKAAEERKNELVAYLAHDIKTPLTSIVGYLTLLDESPDLPVEVRSRYTGITLEKAYRLEELLDEFFEITRYNLHAIPIERSRFDGALFCNQVIEEFFPLAEARGLRLVYDGPAELSVFADAGKVARVLNNVMKNAVAYADPGTDVAVRTSLATGADRFVWWELTVTDRGRELTPQHLERIFERFYRADEARGAQAGGAGLGLAIARETARAHGGDIYVASDAGTTSFTIWIPQGPSVA
ncbi:sensor histidine kinase [Arabiibacter massiliensis]|uniref:sensor histidine kinase n=1 Tax=Arabiibacter massiliensis TaxID=1870985 RepID=UPI0009BBE8DB|nr:HAMP domain-containing sensor histidine kinase [Arabiibacter massiliensis]